MELLRERQQRLGKQGDFLGADAHFAALRAEYLAGHADNIADVVLFEALVLVGVHFVLPGIKLYAPVPVLHVAEADLPHAALAHQASGDSDGPALQFVEALLNLRRRGVPVEAGNLEGVAPLGL